MNTNNTLPIKDTFSVLAVIKATDIIVSLMDVFQLNSLIEKYGSKEKVTDKIFYSLLPEIKKVIQSL